VLSNGVSGHALTHPFAVFGYHVTGSTGTLFLPGIVIRGTGSVRAEPAAGWRAPHFPPRLPWEVLAVVKRGIGLRWTCDGPRLYLAGGDPGGTASGAHMLWACPAGAAARSKRSCREPHRPEAQMAGSASRFGRRDTGRCLGRLNCEPSSCAFRAMSRCV
jgi:hypothetical protein